MIDIVKIIRRKQLWSAAGYAFLCIVCLLVAFGYKGSTSTPGGFSTFIVFSCVFGAVTVYKLIPVFSPTVKRIFRKYGSPEKVQNIVNELEKNKIFEDKNIIMSDQFIISKHNPTEDLVRFKDVLCVSKYRHSTSYNYGPANVDSYGFVLIDKWGDKHIFKYMVKDEKSGDEVGLFITKLCPNAKIGNTEESQEYIKNNKVKL